MFFGGWQYVSVAVLASVGARFFTSFVVDTLHNSGKRQKLITHMRGRSEVASRAGTGLFARSNRLKRPQRIFTKEMIVLN